MAKGPAGINRPFVECPLEVHFRLDHRFGGLGAVAAEVESDLRESTRIQTGIDIDVVAAQDQGRGLEPEKLVVKTSSNRIFMQDIQTMEHAINQVLEEANPIVGGERFEELAQVDNWHIEVRDDEIAGPLRGNE